MTYKEKIKEIDPLAIDEMYAGGVAGCPGDYFINAPLQSINCILPNVECGEKCVLCWNRMYRGEMQYDD